jgi:hypothetical protein
MKPEMEVRDDEEGATGRLPLLARATLLVGFAALAAGCATTGGAFGGGVGDRLLREPPYYAGTVSFPVRAIAHLPIAYQPGASQAELFDPSGAPGSPIAALLEEMNAYLDSLGVTTPLVVDLPRRARAPDVRFGCDQDPFGECIREGDAATGYGPPWMRLSVSRPSREWAGGIERALADAGADRVLVITLEVGQYWPHQRNLRGDKEVRLGSGHHVAVPWLTALDQPVQVLQLTGALVDAGGRVQKVGAEGLIARRTNLLFLSAGVYELLTDADVQQLRSAVRTDRPGEPLVWKAALHDLLADLTARGDLKVP